MIDVSEVLEIHDRLLQEFGGATGVRDMGLLESALLRPFSTFDGKELYETTEEKAAVLLESLIKNHPFVDGNKRTAYTTFRLFLLNERMDIAASQDEKYRFVMQITQSQIDKDQILDWIKKHKINRGS